MVNNFCNRLEILIKENKTKKKDLAKEVGVTPAAVTNLVKGYSNPSLQTIKSIANYYHVSEEWLAYGAGDKIMAGESGHAPTKIFRSVTPAEEQLLNELDHDPELKQLLSDIFLDNDQADRRIVLGRLEEIRILLQKKSLPPTKDLSDEHQQQ